MYGNCKGHGEAKMVMQYTVGDKRTRVANCRGNCGSAAGSRRVPQPASGENW